MVGDWKSIILIYHDTIRNIWQDARVGLSIDSIIPPLRYTKKKNNKTQLELILITVYVLFMGNDESDLISTTMYVCMYVKNVLWIPNKHRIKNNDGRKKNVNDANSDWIQKKKKKCNKFIWKNNMRILSYGNWIDMIFYDSSYILFNCL